MHRQTGVIKQKKRSATIDDAKKERCQFASPKADSIDLVLPRFASDGLDGVHKPTIEDYGRLKDAFKLLSSFFPTDSKKPAITLIYYVHNNFGFVAEILTSDDLGESWKFDRVVTDRKDADNRDKLASRMLTKFKRDSNFQPGLFTNTVEKMKQTDFVSFVRQIRSESVKDSVFAFAFSARGDLRIQNSQSHLKSAFSAVLPAKPHRIDPQNAFFDQKSPQIRVDQEIVRRSICRDSGGLLRYASKVPNDKSRRIEKVKQITHENWIAVKPAGIATNEKSFRTENTQKKRPFPAKKKPENHETGLFEKFSELTVGEKCKGDSHRNSKNKNAKRVKNQYWRTDDNDNVKHETVTDEQILTTANENVERKKHQHVGTGENDGNEIDEQILATANENVKRKKYQHVGSGENGDNEIYEQILATANENVERKKHLHVEIKKNDGNEMDEQILATANENIERKKHQHVEIKKNDGNESEAGQIAGTVNKNVERKKHQRVGIGENSDDESETATDEQIPAAVNAKDANDLESPQTKKKKEKKIKKILSIINGNILYQVK